MFQSKDVYIVRAESEFFFFIITQMAEKIQLIKSQEINPA